MTDDADFELVEPFDIDHGELDGLTLQQAFVLGVEWRMFREQLQTGDSFSRMIHTDNLERLTRLCQRHGRGWQEQILDDDWRILHVSEEAQ